MATVYLAAGDREQAMVLLREAFTRGHAFSVGLHRDIDLESLHDYPPFVEFLRPRG
jgi:hypothetical protein